MLKRTHVAIGFAVAFYFLPHIKTDVFPFIAIVLVASLLPDIESGFASPSKKSFSIPLISKLANKNLLFHTYTFLVVISLVIALAYPVAAFPFFLGYSFHLFLDSFSTQGIRPFWPLKGRSKGTIAPGSKIDMIIFYIASIIAFALLVKLFI